jgi:hypothetical protein
LRLSILPTLALLFSPFLFSVLPAGATTLTYSSYAQWNSNVTGGTELDFTGVNSSGNYSTAAGKTLVPVKGAALPFVFTGPISTNNYYLVGGTFGSMNVTSLLGPTGGSGSLLVTLPTGGQNAVLLAVGTTGAATSATITLSDSQVFTVSTTPNSYQFFGLSISHNIDWLTVSTSSQAVISDFYFGTSKLTQDPPPSAAPESASLYLIAGGLLSLFGGRRRFSKLLFA